MLPLLPPRMLSLKPLSLKPLSLLSLSSCLNTDNSLFDTMPITPPVLALLLLRHNLPSHIP